MGKGCEFATVCYNEKKLLRIRRRFRTQKAEGEEIMKMKRNVALLLAIVLFFTAICETRAYAAGKGEGLLDVLTGDGALKAAGRTEEEPMTPLTPMTPVSPEEPAPPAVIEDLELLYREEDDVILLRYNLTDCAYVRIFVNGRVEAERFTGMAYECDDIEEGREYTFLVEPYNADGLAGAPAEASFTVPYKKAVITDVDADYNLERKVLILDWEGNNIAYVDVYQDDVLIAEKQRSFRLIKEIDLEATSKHVYKIVPYNQNDEAGTEGIDLLEVDDYVARLSRFKADYDEAAKQIRIEWEGVYTEYVEVCLNDETLAEKYTGSSLIVHAELQPGATYVVSVVPYNYKDKEGEEEEEDVSVGYFDIPDEFAASLVNIPVKDSSGNLTGFSRPSVQLSWDAQKMAIYEVYRAEKDKMGSYQWIATIRSEIEGRYVYTDEKADLAKYYYKIRRKIAEDPYIDQELYTALSDADAVNVNVPKPTLRAQLNEGGQIELTLHSGREYVSGYDIYRKCGKGSYRLLATVTEDAYTDTEVEFGKSYHYKAKAYYYEIGTGRKISGKSSKSVSVKNSISGIQVTATAVSSDTVKVEWTPAANADAYEVYYRSGTQGDSYRLLMKTDATSLSRRLSGGGTHYFMIRAVCETGKGDGRFSSAEASVKMGFSAPVRFEVSKTSYERNKANVLIQKDTLCWNQVFGARGYYIEAFDAAEGRYRRVKKIKGADHPYFTVSNPITPEAKPLKYRISAYDSKGKVKKGGTLTLTPMLGTVGKVKVASSGSNIKISWKGVTGAERYRVYRSNGRTMLLIGETADTSMSDRGLGAGVTYHYYVQAVNTTQNLAGENSLPVGIQMNQAKLSGLKADASAAGTVTLSWKTEKDVESCIIYYKDAKSGTYEKLAEVKGRSASYQHTGLKAGTDCYYKVTTVQKNYGGIRKESEGVTAKATAK